MMSRNTRAVCAGGFTLLEALFAAMLIGLAIAALVGTSGAFTMKNAAGVDLSTGEFLIEEIREMTVLWSFDTLESYHPSGPINPPVDLSGTPLPEFSAFSQQITVDHVTASDLSQVDTAGTSDFVRVTVTILKNGRPVTSASWIRARL